MMFMMLPRICLEMIYMATKANKERLWELRVRTRGCREKDRISPIRKMSGEKLDGGEQGF